MWAQGSDIGITPFVIRRLVTTVLSIIFIYLPLSIVWFVNYIRVPKIPYSFSRVHGPRWKVIDFDPTPTATPSRWIGVVLVAVSFSFGLTRYERQFYGDCVEWTYGRLPEKYQAKFSWMQNIVEARKARRDRDAIVNELARNNSPLAEGHRAVA